ncbi:hypothetical protein ONZ45_g3981 [Pleurotus djamor]|nr:hypothetical protein ONZ45_g3981 [Pleurotus djamor]
MVSDSSASTSTRVAIVTGAPDGIGRAVAIRLAQDGLDVVLSGREPRMDKLNGVAAEIRKSCPERRVEIITADVTSQSDIDNLVLQTKERLGSVDVMVANAGTFGSTSVLNSTVQQFDEIFDVNFHGVLYCFQAAAKVMVEQNRGGRLIAASSIAGKKGLPKVAGYCASKAAVRALTQSAAAELGGYGITVNGYAPGVVDTPLLRRSGEESAANEGATIEQVLAGAAIKRIGHPDDVANVVSFLASEKSSYITGQTISIDGGMWFD